MLVLTPVPRQADSARPSLGDFQGRTLFKLKAQVVFNVTWNSTELPATSFQTSGELKGLAPGL